MKKLLAVTVSLLLCLSWLGGCVSTETGTKPEENALTGNKMLTLCGKYTPQTKEKDSSKTKETETGERVSEKNETKKTDTITSDTHQKEKTAKKPTTGVKPVKNTKPDVKPQTKPETKPVQKPSVKPAVKPEVKPEVKPDPKPQPPKEEKFDIGHWVSYAKNSARNKGLTLSSDATYCWDSPIHASNASKYLERDINSRMQSYANDASITDVWVWYEKTGSNSYLIYIGYA